MHYLYLATFNKKKAGDSIEARKYVKDFLLKHYQPVQFEDEPEPRGDYLFYRGGLVLVDWFQIGGRWTGFLLGLENRLWAILKQRGMALPWNEYVQKNWGEDKTGITDTTLVLSENAEDSEIQKIWESIGGKEKHPLSHKIPTLGQEHDASIVTDDIYDRFLKPYEGRAEHEYHFKKDDHPGFADFEEEKVSRSFVGNKWIVVVDCHS